jgi:cytochrome P450
MQRLLAELADDPAGGPYLDAVVRETLRVRPVVGDTARVLAAPAEVAGWHCPRAWRSLRPSRWSTSIRPCTPIPRRSARALARRLAAIALVAAVRSRAAQLSRAGFALFEMRVVLRTILSRLELRAVRPEDERMRLRNITLTPGRGAEVIARSR